MDQKAELKRTLGMWSLVMLGLGYLQPAVIFDTFGVALRDTKGHVPLAYGVTLLAMMFTALSYGKMVKVYSTAGSSYSYAQKTIGPRVGFMVGWLSLLDYLLLPLINILLAQQYMMVIFPGSPSWLWILLITAIVTIINIRGIQSTANINSLFVYFQIGIVIVFIAFCVKALMAGMGLGTIISAQPFYNNDYDFHSVINGATILCYSFLGFDAVSNYAEEAKNPTRDVPRAIVLTAIVGGGLFIVTSYFTQLVFPDTSLFANVENSSSAEISYHVGGSIFQLFFLATSFAGVFASALASHASVSRLLYVMGRDKVLPEKLFGRVSPRFNTPIFNIIFVGIVSLTGYFFTMEMAVHFISFGSLIAFSFVNIAVIVHYVIRHKQIKTAKDIFSHLVLPLIGLAVVLVLWLHIKGIALILGLCWGSIGLIYLLLLKKFARVDITENSIAVVAKDSQPLAEPSL